MDFSAILLNMSSNAAGNTAGAGNSGLFIVLIAFMVVYMYMIMRKEKKQQQAADQMRDNLKIGDEVVTIGGIIGRIVAVKDDSIVIESGSDRNKIRFTKNAIAKNVTEEAKAEEIKKAKLDAAKKAAEEKRAKKKG